MAWHGGSEHPAASNASTRPNSLPAYTTPPATARLLVTCAWKPPLSGAYHDASQIPAPQPAASKAASCRPATYTVWGVSAMACPPTTLARHSSEPSLTRSTASSSVPVDGMSRTTATRPPAAATWATRLAAGPKSRDQRGAHRALPQPAASNASSADPCDTIHTPSVTTGNPAPASAGSHTGAAVAASSVGWVMHPSVQPPSVSVTSGPCGRMNYTWPDTGIGP